MEVKYMEYDLLPADIYKVINKRIITEQDLKILNMLYLPLIGPTALSLYNILVNDLDNLKQASPIISHAHLLSNLHISLKELLESRTILEGIGLLKTYIKQDTINNYIYELYSPVSAHEFFSHPIFNIVLYNNVGKIEYEKLVEYFKIPKISKEGYSEITHTFNQVFKSIPYTSLDIYHDNIRKYNKLKLKIDSNFDMNFLIESMPKQIDKKIFTKDLQELIISLAYLYDIDARNHYQFDHSGLLPTIVEFTQPEFLRKPIGDNSKMAKMIYTFETTSPYDFLRSKHKSAEPTKRDIQLLEDLLIDYKLQPGVINVLIDYVLKTNDNKLTRSLVETIAGQWMRKNIETVEDAMEIARKNHSKSKQIKTIKTTKSYQKEATVPVWFNQNIESASATDEERKALEEMLKEYR